MLQTFLETRWDGLAIDFVNAQPTVEPFFSDRPITSGVSRTSKHPLESIYVVHGIEKPALVLDLRQKERRLDIFLRNSIVGDWELFEVKRLINLVGSYRDIPVLTHELHSAIQQVRNYAAILREDRVRRQFAAEGIEYYQPALRLVIGRKPKIPHAEWRWLLETNQGGVKIITFDDLLAELEVRLRDRNSALRRTT